jgi:hypothetical protein
LILIQIEEALVEHYGFRIEPLVQNQPDCGGKAVATHCLAVPPPVRAGNLRTRGYERIAIAFDDRCESVAHGTSIEREL